MLPPNLLMVSMVVLLLTAVSSAPVEEREQEEVEATEEGDGELSEEEEDDDDSKSQDKIEAGLLGVQQTTAATAVAVAGGGPGVSDGAGGAPGSPHLSASGGHSAAVGGGGGGGGGRDDGTAGSSAGGHFSSVGSAVAPAGSAGSPDSAGSTGSAGSASSAGSMGPVGSAGSAGAPGSVAAAGGPSGDPAGRPPPAGSDGADAESNGNGQKLLNGGGGSESQTGVLGSFGGGASHLDYTGIIDQSSHDFLLGLMGGADPFGPDVHITVGGAAGGPGEGQNSGSSLDPAAGGIIHHSQSGDHHTALSSGQPGQPPLQPAAGPSHAAAHGDGADLPDTNGNGRQTLLTDTNGASVDPVDAFTDLQTQNVPSDLTAGGAELVTGLHVDLTASGLGRGVTEASPIGLHTESADLSGFTHTLHSGGHTHTDLVTVAIDPTGTDAVTADPTGTPMDSSHPPVTDHTQMAGSATEQYNPSGQGPEGAENVELEDTC